MSEVIENDDKTKSERRMIGRPTINQMFGENEEGTLSDDAYARLWSEINETPKNRLLEDLYSRYNQRKRDISEPFEALLKSKMDNLKDANIRKIVNEYLNGEAQKAEIDVSLTENESETAEWWTRIKSRLIDSWFQGKKPNNGKGRFTLYKLSFALGLDWKEHCTLFSKVFRMKTYLRTPAEFCLTYCKKHGLSYAEAFDLYVQYCTKSKEPTADGPVDYQATRAIGEDIFSLKKGEFLTSIIENGNNYFVKSKTILNAIGLDTDKDLWKIYNKLDKVGYCFYEGEKSDKKTKGELPQQIKYEFFVSIASAIKMKETDPGRKHILQLRKLYIILRFLYIVPKENTSYADFSDQKRQTSFVEFIRDIDDNLLDMNLPMLYYSDDFDRGIILAAAYITVCGGWGEFSDTNKHAFPLSDLITAIVVPPRKAEL